MTREEAIKRLEEIAKGIPGYDIERDHIEADSVLCDLLTSLGYEDVVEKYDAIEKYYA